MRCGSPRRAAARLAIGLMAIGATCLPGACARQVTGPSLILRLASPDDGSDPTTSMQVEQFAGRVSALSHATIRIEPVLDADAGALGWDQAVARGVAGGTWDLGLVPGRAWDVLGVTSLRALNTPFLVTSRPALEAVLNDGIRDDLLAGLPAAGVVGLDILPDGMRHPFGYASALRGAADYRDATIRSARSATVAMLFDALGARVTDTTAGSGGQRGAESQFSITPAAIATANITFFPKTDVLVADADVHDRLRPDQWALLRDAAAATRAWMFARLPTDFEAAAAFCGHGGRIVAATAQERAGIEEAGARVTEELRRDAGTRRMIDRIRGLIAGLPAPDPITRCPGTEDATASTGPARLNGVYTSTVTAAALHDAGEQDEQRIRESSGRYTWTLYGGTWAYHQKSDSFLSRTDATGRYTYDDGVFVFHWSDDPREWTRARTGIAGNGTISFTGIVDGRPGAQALAEGFFASPWVRIGKIPG